MFIEEIAEALGGASRIEPVPIPWDCQDGFFHAWWRPARGLPQEACGGGSPCSRGASAPRWRPGCVRALRADLESGAWRERHADLLGLEELNLGYRLLVAGDGRVGDRALATRCRPARRTWPARRCASGFGGGVVGRDALGDLVVGQRDVERGGRRRR